MARCVGVVYMRVGVCMFAWVLYGRMAPVAMAHMAVMAHVGLMARMALMNHTDQMALWTL